MSKIINWFKKNPLVVILFVLFAGYIWWQNFIYSPGFPRLSLPSSTSNYGMAKMDAGMAEMAYDGDMAVESTMYPPQPYDPVAPTASDDRLVITDTSLSLVVKSVQESLGLIQEIVSTSDGFLVDSNLNSPSDAATAWITMRVPNEKRDQVVSQIKDLGLRVTSESVSGRDVTDQFEDLQAKLEVLETTKSKFEVIQEQASEIQDLLMVQRELINVQQQIDALKGRADYLEQSASLSKISVHLATDELALPLTPDQAWRPQLVFKQAVRSLLETLRGFGYNLIWLGVYAVIWLPVLGVFGLGYWVIKRRKS